MTGKAGQVSNGLKSIGANIVKLANQYGELEVKAGGSVEKISLINEETGDLKSTYQVLSEVAGYWDKMSKSEQSALALQLAGKTQISVFSSVLSNFNKAIEANTAATKASGSAMEENAKRADSLEARTASLKREFEELVLGQGGLNSFLKILLSSGTGILKFINTTKALPVILADIGVILTMVLIPKIQTLGASLVDLGLKFLIAYDDTRSFNTALQAVGITASATQLAIGALTAVISIGVLAWNAYKTSQENARVQAEQNAEKSFSQAKSIEEVIAKLKDESIKRKELVEAIESVNSKYSEELGNIEDVNDLRREGIELLTKEARAKIEAARASIASEVTEAKQKTTESTQVVGKGLSKYLGNPTTYSTVRGNYQEIYSYENLEKQTEALKKATEEARKNVEAGTEQQSVLDAINKMYNKSKDSLDAYNEVLEKDRMYFELLNGTASETSDIIENTTSKLGEFNDLNPEQIEEFAKALKMSSEEFEENAIAMGLSLAQYGEYATANKQIQNLTDDTNASIDGLQSALSIAKNAMEEYNKSGELTLDTFQSLLSISPDYLSALINENGQLTVNQETLGNLVEQLKIAKIEELQNAAAADILALANGNVDKMSSTAKKAVSELGSNISDSGDKASTASGKMVGFAASVMAAVNASKGLETGELPKDFEANQKAILDSYTKLGNQIAGITVNTTKNIASGSSKGAKSAKKGAKDSSDAYKEAYEKQRDDLEHSLAMNEISEKEYYAKLEELNERYFGVASGQHEKYLDEYRKNQEKIYSWQKKQEEEALKAQKQTYDKAIDYIKDSLKKKVDLVKKDKDSELKDIDEEISYLEKRRDREIDAVESRIKSIKKEKEAFVDSIDTQIDSLEDLKDKEKEQWDSKINAYKEANKLLNENIELQKLQETLAQAKSRRVKIFKDGGFTYGEDEAAISQAQQAIDDYYTQLKQEKELQALEDARDAAVNVYSQQIEALKNYKETMSNQYDEQLEMLEEKREQLQEYYDNRIEDMKEYRQEVEEEYDAQIEIMENYIENFENMVGEFDEKQNRLALLQIAGANAEKDVWMMRLENLRDFVNEYNRLQEELDEGSTDNEVNYSPSEKSSTDYKSSSYGPGEKLVSPRATGDASIPEDGMFLTGDDKNKRELIVGGKLNGSLMKLSKGDGVVNAKSTNTLAGILNSLPSSLGFGKIKDSNSQGGTVNNMNIDKVYVQADNSKEFISSMAQQFNIGMKQDIFSLVEVN